MNNYTIVVVQFQDSERTYDFFNHLPDVDIDDYVVVDTARGMQIAQVVDFKSTSRYAKKHVVQRVDVESHQKRMNSLWARWD